ncbi:uncharacterized protein ACBR49_020462 [Aulostomus maculatus]
MGLQSASKSSACVKVMGEVCGRRVSLVELPALYGKSPQGVMELSNTCISLCEPEGVHAFILVLRVGPPTDEDKKELEIIKDTFSSRVNDFIVSLFTLDSDITAPDVVQPLKKNSEIQEFLRSCGGRYVVLNIKERQQISEVLDTVDRMEGEGPRSFTKDKFVMGQMEKVLRLQAELQNLTQRGGEEGRRKQVEDRERQEKEVWRKQEESMKTLSTVINELKSDRERNLRAVMDEFISKAREDRMKEWEEDERKWRIKRPASEKRVKLEREEREIAESKLELRRRERESEREAWNKERQDISERKRQDETDLQQLKTQQNKTQRNLWILLLIFLSFLLVLYIFLSLTITKDKSPVWYSVGVFTSSLLLFF